MTMPNVLMRATDKMPERACAADAVPHAHDDRRASRR